MSWLESLGLKSSDEDWERFYKEWDRVKQEVPQDLAWAGQRLKDVWIDTPKEWLDAGTENTLNFTGNVVKKLFDHIENWEEYAKNPQLGSASATPSGDELLVKPEKMVQGQKHNLAYITDEEAEILKDFGGAGVDSDQDGVKEYFVLDFLNNLVGGNNPANEGKSYIGADEWTYGADDKGEGGFTMRTPEAANKLDPSHPDYLSDAVYEQYKKNHNNNKGGGNNNTKKPEPPAPPKLPSFDLSNWNTMYGDASSAIGGADMYSLMNNGLSDSKSNISSAIGDLTTASGGNWSNMDAINNLLGKYQGLDTTLSGLQGQYDTAVSDTNALIDNYEKGLAKSLLGSDDWDMQDVNAARDLRTQLQSSDIDFDYDTGIDRRLAEGMGLTDDYQSAYSDALGNLNTIIGNYDTAAEGLDTSFRGLGFGDLLNTVRGMDMTGDTAGSRNTLNQYITEAERLGNATGLSDSQIEAIFQDSGIGNKIQDIRSGLSQTEADRAAEEARIARAQSDALAGANTAFSNIGSSGYYSKSMLDQLQNAITQGQGAYEDFSSPLAYDFTKATNQYGSAQTTLNDLLAQRKRRLDTIEGDLSGAYSPLADLDLWEEREMNKILSGIDDVDYDLGYFTGGRVGDIYSDLDSYRRDVTNKLGELSDYREGIETRSKGLYDRLMGEDVNRANYDAFLEEFDPIRAEIDKYTASQAYDERGDITAELASRLAQIEQDEANVAARTARANADNNDFQFQDYRLVDPLTSLNRGALYSADEEEEELLNNPASAFSRNILRY
tara:strand:+ start:1826 stop:4165 length:2340 start_codon:yes stop_codon:yes gene_type:complete